MTLMKDKARDNIDELEFSQGQDLDEDEGFTFFGLERPDGKTVDAGFAYDEALDIAYGSEPYTSLEPDYSKLRDVLPNFEQELARFELERDTLKDRYTHAWNQGDMVSHLALEVKYYELNGFIKGLNVLKDVLRHWEEYDWGEMDISDYYPNEDVLKPMQRQAAQRKVDTLTSRALQILSRQQSRKQDPS